MNTIPNQDTTNMSYLPVSSKGKNSTTEANSQTSAEAMSSNFLKMLVTQMQYQDPTNPVSSSDMTSQLAQISTVQGISDLNKTVTSVLDNLKLNQLNQNANLIGRSVATPGQNFSLTNGQAKFGLDIPSPADRVSVSIVNAGGQTVQTLNLGSQPAGVLPINWNGISSSGSKVADGNYSLQINATSAGKPIAATGLQYAKVSSVSSGANGSTLNLDNKQAVSGSSVKQIL